MNKLSWERIGESNFLKVQRNNWQGGIELRIDPLRERRRIELFVKTQLHKKTQESGKIPWIGNFVNIQQNEKNYVSTSRKLASNGCQFRMKRQGLINK